MAPHFMSAAVADFAGLTPPLAFTEVYAAWFRHVYRWVRAHGCAESELDDLTQEVFIIVQRKLPEFDGRNLPAWLYRIVTLTVRDHRRSAWFRNLFMRPRGLSLEAFQTGETSALELLEARDARDVVQQIIAEMNPKWRTQFALFEIEDMSGEEIAGLQGVPLATVWTHLHRARKEFTSLVTKRMQKEAAR